jgi:hypothetical protein
MVKKHAELQIPADPLDFLKFIIREAFDGSPAAFARAASVSRAGVNKWLDPEKKPPAGLNNYVKKALESELAEIAARHAKIAEIEVRAKHRDDLLRLAVLKLIRKSQVR